MGGGGACARFDLSAVAREGWKIGFFFFFRLDDLSRSAQGGF